MIGAWITFGVVVVLLVAAVFSAHIPGLRTLTGAAPLQPDERPGGTLRRALGEPECLDDLTISHDHTPGGSA